MQALNKTNHHPDQRIHKRVVFTRTVKLIIGGEKLGQFPARNLSMGGLFIEGDKLDFPVKTPCKLELYETGKQSSLILKFSANIVRCDKNGIAVEFKDMEDDSFMFLQTMVLYASDDPVGIVQDFLEEFDEIEP